MNNIYQVIDSDHYEEAGIKTFKFPGGEPHVQFTKPVDKRGLLFLKLRTWDEVGYAALIIDAIINEHGMDWRAFIPYYPGARQDRRTGPYSPETVTLMWSLLHSHFVRTWTFDPHSDTLKRLEPRFLMPTNLSIPIKPDVVGIIAPDHGALSRAGAFRDTFYPHSTLTRCSKERNPSTGFIESYTFPDLEIMKPGRYIVVDDICDGGATFNVLAKSFAQYPLRYKLELFVSHGIFSKTLANLNPRIEHITTTDSFCCMPSVDRLTVLPLNQLFDRIMESD